MGIFFSWSIFMPALERQFGWDRAQTSLPFSICLASFCVGCICTGIFSKFWAGRVNIRISAVLVCGGLFLAATADSLAEIYIGYGVLMGLGLGIAYNAILSAMLRWFPDRLGLASGMLMMGFGLGSMLISAGGSAMIAAFDWQFAMRFCGLMTGGCLALGSFFIAPPGQEVEFPPAPEGKKAPAEKRLELTTPEMLRRGSFYVYFAWATLIYATGLMLMGHAVPLLQDLKAAAGQTGALAGIIATCNGLGRLLSGLALDRYGRKILMRGVCFCFIAASAVTMLSIKGGSLLLLCLAFAGTGLGYGATASCTAAIASLFYGMKSYSLNFSLLNCSVISASVLGPYLAGKLYMATGGYSAMSMAMLTFAGLALLLNALLKKP
jgi:OFA family oxalate/formate antiporter-like MFS transporter